MSSKLDKDNLRDSVLLENVQRRATKMVPSVTHMDYVDRLRALKLPSLKFRRRRGDMIEAYKYVQKIYRVHPSPFQLDETSPTRGHKFKLQKKRVAKSARQHFFTIRVINDWNGLPEVIVDSPNINTFKNRLDKHWIEYHFVTPKF